MLIRPVPEPVTAPADAPLVVVADDSPVQRMIIAALLQGAGYRVAEAGNGRDALDLCAAGGVSFLISDWMMPELPGTDLCRAVRALPQDDYIYTLLLTSKQKKQDIAEGLMAGADDFLVKPVTSVELMARLKAGQRVLDMERELRAKTRALARTLSELEKAHEALDRDLQAARQLQASLIPSYDGRHGSARVSLLLQPSGHVGGDLVGFFAINPTQLGLFSLDVSGHGVSSALLSARLSGLLSSSEPDRNVMITRDNDGAPVARPVESVAEDLNRRLLQEMKVDLYFTAILAVLDHRDGRMQGVQAGHPHGLCLRADGSGDPLGQGGHPIGLLPDAVFEPFEAVLTPGDRVLFASDGISECFDAAGRQLGEDGVFDLLRRRGALSGREMLAALVQDLQGFAGHAEFEDDISALLIEILPDPVPPD